MGMRCHRFCTQDVPPEETVVDIPILLAGVGEGSEVMEVRDEVLQMLKARGQPHRERQRRGDQQVRGEGLLHVRTVRDQGPRG